MSEDVTLPQLVATSIIGTAPHGVTIPKQDLADAVSEITLETQIYGASTLTVTLSDPDWTLVTSGLFGVSSDGVLSKLEINFPDGSNSWWRLCMLDFATVRDGPNLTLTFEDRIVTYLREHWGPKTVPPGTLSRAEFVKQLVDEVKANGGIRFVCPALGKALPPVGTS